MKYNEVIIEVIANTKPLTVVYSCPNCCSGKEGIRSEIPTEIEADFLDSILSDRGCLTPCPNCGENILLKADSNMRDHLEDLKRIP
jgi:predicted RNA-binding Zn-ribbon protein involved in translation (DUF1610 family)